MNRLAIAAVQPRETVSPDPSASLEGGITRAAEALLDLQQGDGHWVFELEADATIPSEYVLLKHFLGEADPAIERKIANYLRSTQGAHGGWPLFHDGDFNLSASVKAYFALKACGDDAEAPHMRRAREAILAAGGAAHCNVFCRIQLALFGEMPWKAVPVMPVEIMNLPKWFPFHLDKVSYWSRTVMVPLFVLMAKKPLAANPRKVTIRELYTTPPDLVTDWSVGLPDNIWTRIFGRLDKIVRVIEPYFPKGRREVAIRKALDWIGERLNGEDGLGGIYPAMANTVMVYTVLGIPKDDPRHAIARASVEKLLVVKDDIAYCQPCLSPVWDTGLAAHALLEAGEEFRPRVDAAAEWLKDRQVLDVVGDWAAQKPGVRPGGWAFQYANPHYPDLDDTAVVVMALDRLDRERYREAIERGAEWILGLQSENGGFAAFDADNTHHHLNYIPFADHGALLDPPTADVTARCVGMLMQLGYGKDHPAVRRAVEYLMREQEEDGSWFGRWGTNYIYGTWSVLASLNAAGVDPQATAVRRAVAWLAAKQRPDGGWGEDGASYWPDQPRGEGKLSTASQTAWALLALMAAGEVEHPAVERGIRYLLATQNEQGLWDEAAYTAVGFPKVFYLRYHGYPRFFPLWAMARYRNLMSTNSRQVQFGI